MVRGKPRFREIWPKIEEMLATHCPTLDVVAHHAVFDRGMLEDELERMGVKLPRWNWRCSENLAKQVRPGLASYALSGRPGGPQGLRDALSLPRHSAHRAEGDVLTMASLLRNLRDAAGPWKTWRGEAVIWGAEKPEKKAKKSKSKDDQTMSLFEYAVKARPR